MARLECGLATCNRCERAGFRPECRCHAREQRLVYTPARHAVHTLCRVCDDILMTILDDTITQFVANKKEN